MSNTIPKIKINYAKNRSSYYDDDKDSVSVGITESDAAVGRKLAMKGDKHELRKIIESKRRRMFAIDDDGFMNWLKKELGEEIAEDFKLSSKIYLDQMDELSDKKTKHMARKGIKYKLNKDILTSLSKGMESPAQEIFSGIMEALSTAAEENAKFREEIKFQEEVSDIDEINIFSPEEADFFTKSVPEEKLKDIVGKEDYEKMVQTAAEVNKTTESDELEPNKKPSGDELKKIKNDKWYIYDKDYKYLAGPFDTKDDAEKSAEYKKDTNGTVMVELHKGDTYKSHLSTTSFSYIPKIKLNRSYTIVRSYNLFSKISEFIKERFPKNFSGIDGKRILLNDGRYLKVKIADELNFSVTSYVKDQKQFSVILPLKVHKFKWQNSINDNIINK